MVYVENASYINIPESKVGEANVGTIWGREDPGRPHLGPMNLAIRDVKGIIRVGLSVELPCNGIQGLIAQKTIYLFVTMGKISKSN